MQIIIAIGIPASGKSSFFKEMFWDTHIRVNMDMLNTRNKERALLEFCLEYSQPLFVDNTNVSIKDRKRYIDIAKHYEVGVSGYYMQSNINDCLKRNEERERSIPKVGVLSMHKRLELPSYEEGFDEINYVKIEDGKFIIEKWREGNETY